MSDGDRTTIVGRDGPSLPRPTRQVLETAAAYIGVFYLVDEPDPSRSPHVFEALADLLDVDPSEAKARIASLVEWEQTCWDIFARWADERGLAALGYDWDGESDPEFVVEPKGRC